MSNVWSKDFATSHVITDFASSEIMVVDSIRKAKEILAEATNVF
jgi:hypothetical protein